MSINSTTVPGRIAVGRSGVGRPKEDAVASRRLAATITRAASKQTYYTIHTLVDRDRVADAFRAYAYFRWVDDTLDQPHAPPAERLAFVRRQQALLSSCRQRQWPGEMAPEEQLLLDLVDHRRAESDGLHAYLDNMMAVMAFDAQRRSRLISGEELDAYTNWLAKAVTEALHYFIGHCCHSPRGESRYRAVSGAHITHMLRDTLEDVEAGYFNVPREFLAAHGIGAQDLWSDPYCRWVQERVHLARAHFAAGKVYLAEVESLRCRLAGCAYIARFEGVLDAIEREGYRLRAGYPECKGVPAMIHGCRLLLGLARRSKT
jgi:phytoene/squalene synthetase